MPRARTSVLRADEGKLELEQFASNEALPEITTPAPAPRSFAEHYDRFGARTFWPNANMSPDFPAVAQLMAGMWKQGTGNDVDGVMAIDAVGLNHLLGLVGSTDVPTMGEVDSGNFLQFALNEAYIRFEAREDRSRVLLDVGMGVWSRILWCSSSPACTRTSWNSRYGCRRAGKSVRSQRGCS